MSSVARPDQNQQLPVDIREAPPVNAPSVEERACSVCLMAIEQNARTFSFCNQAVHNLHWDCAGKWFVQRNSCPECRAPAARERIPQDFIDARGDEQPARVALEQVVDPFRQLLQLQVPLLREAQPLQNAPFRVKAIVFLIKCVAIPIIYALTAVFFLVVVPVAFILRVICSTQVGKALVKTIGKAILFTVTVVALPILYLLGLAFRIVSAVIRGVWYVLRGCPAQRNHYEIPHRHRNFFNQVAHRRRVL